MRTRRGPYEPFKCVICDQQFERKVGGGAVICHRKACCKLAKAAKGLETPFDPGSAAAKTTSKNYQFINYDGKIDIDA